MSIRTRRLPSPAASALALVLAALALPAAPSRASLPNLEDDWGAVRAGRLVAYSSLSRRDTGRIVQSARRFRRDIFGPGRPFHVPDTDTTKIFLFEDEDAFRAYEPSGQAVYRAADGAAYVLLRKKEWEAGLERMYALESLRLLGEAGPAMPEWLRRGLGEFYSTYRFGENRALAGRRLDRNFDLIRKDGALPWERLLSARRSSRDAQSAVFDAQAWIAVHYLLTETEASESGAAAWVDALASGADADSSFARAFGFPFAELPSRVDEYAGERSFDEIELPIGRREDDAEADLSEPSRALLLAELGEMTAALSDGAAPERAAELLALATEHLEAALAAAPELAGAHRGLGDVALRRGDAAGALPKLRRAVELAPRDLRARTLTARALLEPLLGSPDSPPSNESLPPAVTQARGQLIECLRIDKDYVPAHVLLGRSYLPDPGDPTPGIRELEIVRSLLPGRSDVVFSLVGLLMKAGALDRAFPLLDPGDPDDPGRRRMRVAVVDQALRTAARKRAGRDYDAVIDLVDLVRDRAQEWNLPAEQTQRLAGFDDLEKEAAHSERSGGVTLSADGRVEPAAPVPVSALAPGVAKRQYDEYLEAVQLSSDKKYKRAMEVLAGLVGTPHDEKMHDAIITLWDQVRYNRALGMYQRGEYAPAMELARDVRIETPDDGIRNLAKTLVRSCRAKLAE